MTTKRRIKSRRRKKRLLGISCTVVMALVLMGIILFMETLLSGNRMFTNIQLTENIVKQKGLQEAYEDRVQLDEINSGYAVLVDREKGAIMAEKDMDEAFYPASLTKIMTAIVALENIDNLNKRISLDESMFESLYAANASMAGFEPGEEVKALDLLYGILLPSGAECCLGIAQDIAGSEEAYVSLMNQKAKELGMEDTRYRNTTGLSDDKHVTTARDMAILLNYCLENKVFREIFTSASHATASTNLHLGGITFYSTLFQNMPNETIKGGAILGGKTGYTSQAGLCLASLAKIGGKEYILITAKAAGNHSTEQFHIEDAYAVYNQIL